MPVKVHRSYFMLMVEDMDRAIAFYRSALGLDVRFSSSEWTELDCDGTTIALHHGRQGGEIDTGLGFEVDDIDAACVQIREARGRIVEPPKQQPEVDLRLATVADTEGNRFSLVQTG